MPIASERHEADSIVGTGVSLGAAGVRICI